MKKGVLKKRKKGDTIQYSVTIPPNTRTTKPGIEIYGVDDNYETLVEARKQKQAYEDERRELIRQSSGN
jgi:hypothetical protein